MIGPEPFVGTSVTAKLASSDSVLASTVIWPPPGTTRLCEVPTAGPSTLIATVAVSSDAASTSLDVTLAPALLPRRSVTTPGAADVIGGAAAVYASSARAFPTPPTRASKPAAIGWSDVSSTATGWLPVNGARSTSLTRPARASTTSRPDGANVPSMPI